MDRPALIAELKGFIEGFLKSKDLELVDLIYRYEGRDLVLRILVDKPEGGITIDECSYLNKDISLILDEKGALERSYILEVSSPGLDRPLKTEKDFLRCLDRKARLFLKKAIDGKVEMEGVIIKVEGELLHIETEGKSIAMPLAGIAWAKQIIGNI